MTPQSESDNAALNELTLTVKVMASNYATKEELATAINLQTWRMAAFGSLLLSAGFAFARFL